MLPDLWQEGGVMISVCGLMQGTLNKIWSRLIERKRELIQASFDGCLYDRVSNDLIGATYLVKDNLRRIYGNPNA